MTMERQQVPRTVRLPGRAVAYEQVDIRPRVDGVIEAISYVPGKTLAVGDVLFQLDDASYVATVASDEADLAKAEARLPVSQAAYDRAEKLAGKGYTAAEVEEARATLAEAKATLDAAKAALEYARTQLSWTTIRSPIEGVADVQEVSVGDLVTSGQSDALTTVTRLDPIYIDLSETSSRILSFRSQLASGVLKPNDTIDAALTLENGEVYQGSGTLVTLTSTVSTTTGTVTVRFRFDNPDRVILPGMFLRGELTLGTVEAFLVPQRAAERDNTGRLSAFVVGEDGAAKKITFTDIGSTDSAWIVNTGIEPGARLILNGLKTLREGMAVAPVAATLDADGLVVEESDAPPDDGTASADDEADD